MQHTGQARPRRECSKGRAPSPWRRCLGGDGLLPVPRLVLEAEGPLVYDEAEWEQGWHAQGSDVTYRFKLALSGHPG